MLDTVSPGNIRGFYLRVIGEDEPFDILEWNFEAFFWRLDLLDEFDQGILNIIELEMWIFFYFLLSAAGLLGSWLNSIPSTIDTLHSIFPTDVVHKFWSFFAEHGPVIKISTFFFNF